MTLARRLREAGHEVTLFEAAPALGGLASAWELGDVVWDRHYHVTLLSDHRTRGLVADLGLAHEMEFRPTRTGFFSGGRLLSMSTSLEFLRFPLLGLKDKARLAATILHASRIRDFRGLERVPVETWLRRWSGDRTFERVWLPLLRSKLGEAWRETSAAFIWATIARLYAARRSGMKREMFGYVRGGYARVLDAFTRRLEADGVQLRTGCPVAVVRRTPAGLSVEAKDGSREEFDQVAVTLPAPLAARLCPDLDSDERERLCGVRYVGIVCASLLLKRPLSGFYVTNITDEGLPFTGVIEMTALVDRAHFGGRSLVYLPRYVPPDDPLFERGDGEVRESFLAGLRRMHPDLAPDDVVAFRVSRARQVFALSTLGYSDRLPPLTTSVPGLHLVSSAHVLNGTLNVNETLRLAEWAAAGLASPERRVTLPPLEEGRA
jgi:protoporphyrinogen oxidase